MKGQQGEVQPFDLIHQLAALLNDNRHRLIFAPVQMLQHLSAGIQRHLIFGGYPAHNYAYL
ncbi:hypothetical protein D3C79_1053270 [compost metagenome]